MSLLCPAAAAKRRPASAPPVDPEERWKGIAEPGSPIAAGLDAIVQGDPTFDAKHFVAGARQAYEMIVTAYAEGDRRSLRNLLSKDVYEGFETAIRERETNGRDRRDPLRLDRPLRHHWRGSAWADRAGHRAVRLAARFGHP